MATTPNYPGQIWDGSTRNIDRVDRNSVVNPNSQDWDRAAAEVIARQNHNDIITILNPVTVDGDSWLDDQENKSVIVFIDATSNDVQLIMPPFAQNLNTILTVKRIDSSGNRAYLDVAPSTIDGVAEYDLSTQYDSVTIYCDGTEWWIISEVVN